jgi:hypothetical protein
MQAVPQTPQPQQGDSLDQASKLIDLIDKLGQRNSGANLAPGTSQFSPMNSAQFQSANPSQIAMQELLLRNPQLLAQLQQGQQQKTEAEGSKTFSPQEVQTLKTQLETVYKCANEHKQQLEQLWAFTQQVMSVFNAFAQYTQELETVAQLGVVSQSLANSFQQELAAVYEVADIQYAMLNTPQFALMHTSNLIKHHIDGTDDAAMQLISEEYVDTCNVFEEKKLAKTGKYSDIYKEYLQSAVNSQQTQIGQDPNAKVDDIVNWANGLKSQGFGQQIKRGHTQRLLNR